MADDNTGVAEKTGGSTASLIDSKDTPTIFADGIHGMSIRDGVLLLNLTRTIFGIPKSQMDGNHSEAVARLMIPLPAYLRIAKFMMQSLSLLMERGIIDKNTIQDILEEKNKDA